MSSFLGSSWKQVGGYQRTPVGNYARFPYLASELAFIDNLSSGIVPIGGIIMWSGATIDLQNWVLCDGTSYVIKGNTIQTPDLRNKFIFGSGGTYLVDSSGGSSYITVNQMPTHSHIINIMDPGHNHHITDPGHNHHITDPGHNHVVNDPGHVHPITDIGHNHDVSNNTHNHGINDPGHLHDYGYGGTKLQDYGGPEAAVGNRWDDAPSSSRTQNAFTGISTANASSNVSLESATTGISINNHVTDISLNPSYTSVTVDLSYTSVTVDLSYTEITSTADTSGNGDLYMPPYYVLAFIMRIS